jgi:hypothetical protein
MNLFRPVGVMELELIAASGFRKFPPRRNEQPFFYPVLSIEYARQIARDWNTKDANSGFAGFVTQFEVSEEFVKEFRVQTVGNRNHRELWVPAEQLGQLNDNILGLIAVLESHYGERFEGKRRESWSQRY